MPTYVYQAAEPEHGCPSCSGSFELWQRMADEPLSACPQCQAPVRRLIQAAFFSRQQFSGKPPSDSKLEQLGFTKIVKDDDGKYKKLFGNDPAANVLPSLKKD